MTNTYSIIESCGRQFWVEPQKFYDFYDFRNRRPNKTLSSKSFKIQRSEDILQADKILFDQVLILTHETDVYLGHPFLDDFRVEASLLPGIRKQSKLYVFKMRSKKRFRRKIGYRMTSQRIKFNSLYRKVGSKLKNNLEFLVKGY
uniref:Ribosomal protein L21 n=1 Tax=Eustigmatophyceae sp. Mont 10/10-1w TaxID=2506145 RepID=A0A451FMS1_9STRA|nr:ribosomal protein L21 [Eustigmatophyceae sp. Mont 10/10-1w]QAA11713.1 ribosomal protein L21 [Eustigmatophyceae sp. Mont 10/10-1w]